MKQTYQNDLDMFGVVRDYLTTHAAQLTAVPAIATLATELGQKIAAIDAADAVVVAPITGIAADKEELRTNLEEAAFAVSEPLATFALATGNLTLRDEVDETRSGLDKLDAAVLDAFAERVAARATTNLASLTPYGVVQAMITAIGTARTAFAAMVNDPRSAIVERAAQTESIPTLIRDVKTRLLRGQLDRLMNRYRLTAPTLYGGYRSARTIVDRAGGAGGGSGGTPPPEPPGPPQNVGLNVGAVDSGELGVTWEPPEGSTGAKIWRELPGSPPTLLATLTDVTAQPHVLTFTPGETVSIFVTATRAGAESEPSTTVSATAP